jgi:hypothetical protein
LANLFKILAASVGGGLVLGAGIRLGEVIANRELALLDHDSPDRGRLDRDRQASRGKLADRGALENRPYGPERGFESETPAMIAARFDAQTAEMTAVRAHLRKESRQLEELGETSVRLRGELQGWLENNVTTRMTEVEARLKSEAERGQRQMLDAFVDSVETRVIKRISTLEEEVSGQSAATTELCACSLRTEQSMQKLLGGLDRMIKHPSAEEAPPIPPAPAAAKFAEPEPATPPPVDPTPLSPPSFAEPRRRSRWSIFG